MFRSKKDVDAHVRDVFSKCTSENERLKLCFGIAKQYAGIKEFDSARRYLDTYLGSNPANLADGQKLMGDIQLELGDGDKALEAYKASYSLGKARESLNRVCDLFSRGYGANETPESKKKWFDMQKLPAGSTSLNSSNINNHNISPAVSRRNPIAGGPPKSGFSNSLFTNGNSSPLVTSASKTNGGNVDLQLRYLERRFDDGLGKILDQNTIVLDQMVRLKEEMKEMAEKIDLIAATQGELEANIKEIQDQQKSNPLTVHQLTPSPMNVIPQPTLQHTCTKCVSRDEERDQAASGSHSSAEFSSLKEQIERLEKLTIKAIDNFTKDVPVDKNQIQANAKQAPPPPTSSLQSIPQEVKPPEVPLWKIPISSDAKPLAEMFKQPEGSWNCGSCYLNNDGNATVCVACQTSRPGFENLVKPEPQPTAPIPTTQPTFSFGFPPPPATATANPVMPSLNFGMNNVASVGVVNNANNETEAPKKNEAVTDNAFSTLNLSGKFSFADLAKTNNNSNFSFGSTGTAAAFTGAGSPLFSSLAKPSTAGNKSAEGKNSNNSNTVNNTSANADEGEDDFVPTAEFQPVIPLPPLIEVKKGDENENTIAEYRAKLYRFNAESKEWKERGVGNIKLLQAKDDPNKSRVVMWREKIGKLACNFSLFPDLKVENYQKNPKVLVWKCQDYSEEPSWETFTLRFSNEENCKHFKEEMERLARMTQTSTNSGNSSMNQAKEKDDKASSDESRNESKSAENSSNVPLSELFKKPEGSWNCGSCYLNNDGNATVCVACQTSRPGFENLVKPEAQPTAPISTTQPTFSFGFPSAPAAASANPVMPGLNFGVNNITPIGMVNNANNETEAPKKNEGATDNAFSTLNLSGKFSFADLAKTNNNSNFSFGSTGTAAAFTGAGSPLFSSLAKPSAAGNKSAEGKNSNNSNTVNNTSANADEGEDDFVPTAEFQPVIPLPPLIEVKKGDENENTIAEYRAKLYRFNAESKEWKERGVGNIKLLQAKDDPNKSRVVMWREKIGKLACNFSLFPDMKVSNYQGNPKVLVWKCQDYAEDPSWETFTLRFSSEENCKHFKEEMERLARITQTSTSSGSISMNLAQEKDEKPSSNESRNESKSAENSSNVPLSELFKKPEGSWNCGSCYLNNDGNATVCVACQTSRPGFQNLSKPEAQTDASIPAMQPTFSFGFPPAAANPAMSGLNFGVNNITPIGMVNNANNETLAPKKNEAGTDNAFSTLNLSGKFSFADLAKTNNNSNFSFGSTGTAAFTGTGSPLFSSLGNPAGAGNRSAEDKNSANNTSTNADEGEDDFVPTAEFQPVIPLPPLVEVKKGDENENTIVEYRAKIYRFVAETKEWKERGVGNIKLLQAKEDPMKCRVVMWREKIGKLACNFSLFPDMKVSNYQGNPKVLVWKCQDYAEEPSWETFTVRFGTEENCENFKNKMLEYAQGAPSAKIGSPVAEEKVSSCPGCDGCDPETYKIPDYPINSEEACIDLPLSPDSPTEPLTVSINNFEESPQDNETRYASFPQVVPDSIKKDTSDVKSETDSTNNSLSSFSFAFKPPEKTDSNASPISFQMKSPTFSFKSPGADNNTSIFGGSLFSSPAGSTTAPSNPTTPFASPFAQQFSLNNSASTPPVPFSFSQSNFQQSLVQPAPAVIVNDNDSDQREEDEYEDVDDEEDECMFEEDAHIYIQNEAESSESFVDKGEGVIRVLYDGDSYCARLVVLVNGDVVTEHLVASETVLKKSADNLSYEWNGICNFETTTSKSRIKATFNSDDAYQNFSSVMQDSLEFAEQAGVTEAILLEESYQ